MDVYCSLVDWLIEVVTCGLSVTGWFGCVVLFGLRLGCGGLVICCLHACSCLVGFYCVVWV